MSLSSISPQLPRFIEQNPVLDPRLQVNEGEEGGCMSTVLKVAAFIAGLIASIGSFVILGPIVGVVVALICGTGLLLLFSSCCGSSHDHHRAPNDAVPVYTPWYQRVFSYIPTLGIPHSPSGPHVPVGQGHGTHHVPVGHGHREPAPRPWYDFFSYLPTGYRDMNNGSNVPVGGGHNVHGGHVGVGRGHATPPGHGHGTPPGHGRGTPPGQGPTHVPPPSGATGHVPVGRGHRHY